MASRGQNWDIRSHLLILSNFLKSWRCLERENYRLIFSICPSVIEFRAALCLSSNQFQKMGKRWKSSVNYKFRTSSKTCSVTAANDDDVVVVFRNQKSASVNALMKYFRNVMMLTQVTWRSFIGLGRLQTNGVTVFPTECCCCSTPTSLYVNRGSFWIWRTN